MKLEQRISIIESNQSNMIVTLNKLLDAIQSAPGHLSMASNIKTDIRSLPVESQRRRFRKMIERKWHNKYGILN